MIHIYICDDSKIHLDAITAIVETNILFSEMPMKLNLATTKPQHLLQQIDSVNSEDANVYFLDIDLSNQHYDGLKLATKIREKDPFGFIIFITSHIEFGFLTFEYKIGAFDYILKTDDTDLLTNKIKNVLKTIEKRWHIKMEQDEVKNQINRIRFVSDYEEKYFAVHEIFAVEVIGNHKLHVMTTFQSFESNGTLGKLEKELPNYFFRCHRSHIVNLKKIQTMFNGNELITLSNGYEVRCSRKNKKILSAKLQQLKKESFG